jgi:hypothetical protein
LESEVLLSHQCTLRSPLKRQNRNLRPHTKAKAKTEADPFVYVNARIIVLVHARRETTSPPAQHGSPQFRQMDLPAVRVAAQHEITPMPIQDFHRARIMG